MSQGALHFDGESYDPEQDGKRLGTQLQRVKAAMMDGQWHTLNELMLRCGGHAGSISARIRDLRKKRYGGYTVERRRAFKGSGTWGYRVVLDRPTTGEKTA